MKTLYQKGKLMKSLKQYFSPYIELLTKPTGEKLFITFIAIIVLQELRSIRFLYQWFMGIVGKASLNAYYYMMSYTEVPLAAFRRITVGIALSCIPNELKQQPVFLTIDDTLQEKYGVHFECYQKLFDHTKRNGTNYLDGHCFVGLMINIPVWLGKQIRYLCIPVGYGLRHDCENKLEIASSMIRSIMPVLSETNQVILLCDSWYPKGAILKTVAQYTNLELIANVRADTALYDLPPAPTGKRGRPAKKGKSISIYSDFAMSRVGDYFVGAREAITNLFKHPVFVTVSASDVAVKNTYRVFLSTILPSKIMMNLQEQERENLKTLQSDQIWLLPYYLYGFRWRIEVIFYEHKTFWALGQYMIRKQTGIENYVNFVAVVYAAIQLLPFTNSLFSSIQLESNQSRKYMISNALQRELFFFAFVDSLETGFYSKPLWDAFDSLDIFNRAS